MHKKTDYRDGDLARELFLKELKKEARDGIMVHTCNRVEFYSGEGLVSKETICHLFRLVSGLESVFKGETFIQGQVKEAYQVAAQKYKLSSSLHRVFQWAFLTGKRVRTETSLSRGAMSHSHAVVEIIKEQSPGYENKRFTFIGINKMNRTIMNFLKNNVHNSFLLCNRSFDKALEMENQFNCKAYRLDHLKKALEHSDILISGTSAPHAIDKKEHLPAVASLTIFDLAVPADIDPEVRTNPSIKYFSLKEIENQVNGNKAIRSGEIEKAEVIIAQEVGRFLEYQDKRHQFSGKTILKTESL
jgi:glutamyl-tRNA reductase